jgi:hypothetical protein
MERHLAAVLVASDPAGELPVEGHAAPVREPEPIVQRRPPAAGRAPPPRTGNDPVDRHLEHPACYGAANLDRANERVSGVELRMTRLEHRSPPHVPAGGERREADRVPRVDREDRLEVAREVPVQRPPLEGDLVQHYAARTRRTASVTRSTEGM